MDKDKQQIHEQIFNQLNENQREAVSHFTGPLLILAGAGSGKTRVITYRIAYLIKVRDVDPEEIIAVTFTNKAANEMKQRVKALIGDEAGKVIIKTFHSLGLTIVRENYLYLNLKPNFSIYDPDMQINVLRKVYKELNIDLKTFTIRDSQNQINYAKDNFLSPEEYYEKYKSDIYRELFYEIYKKYNQILRENNAVDFGDLLYLPVWLFNKVPQILEYYQNKWKFIMVDEFQDTNYIQYLLVSLITELYQNIVVVGDDDQCIYSWRGANIYNILEFEKDFQGTKLIKLEENYRSNNYILNLANQLIKNNQLRKPKKLFSRKHGGHKPVCLKFYDELEEVNFIASEILMLTDQYSFDQIAVFYRTNAQSRVFEQKFREKRIPYSIVGGFRFFERKEIKDLLSYLHFLNNPFDFENFERMILNPPKGIGEKALEEIKNYADKQELNYYDALKKLVEEKNPIKIKNFNKIKDFFNLVSDWKEMIEKNKNLSSVVEEIINDIGIIEYYEKSGDSEKESRIENILEFKQSIIEYESLHRNLERAPTLSEYLQDISLITSDENLNLNEGSIKLMTLHNAKGLEFPVVFITGLIDGILPHALSINNGLDEENQELEEERRLFYVGITRAMDKLYLTYSETRRSNHEIHYRSPSRFLKELGLIEKKPKNYDFNFSSNESEYVLNAKYFHAKYGIGTLIDINQSNQETIITLEFDKGVKKRFVANLVKLKKI